MVHWGRLVEDGALRREKDRHDGCLRVVCMWHLCVYGVLVGVYVCACVVCVHAVCVYVCVHAPF